MRRPPRQVETLRAPVFDALELQRYRVRDLLLGDNECEQQIEEAQKIASLCRHEECCWLTQMFAGKKVSTVEEAKEIFLEREKTDERARTFAALMTKSWDLDLLETCSSDALALAKRSVLKGGKEKLLLAELSAKMGEREGFYELASFAVDVATKIQMFLRAAELGSVWAGRFLTSLIPKSDSQRFFWIAHSVNPKWSVHPFFSALLEEEKKWKVGTGRTRIMFILGRALVGQIDSANRTLFGTKLYYNVRVEPAITALTTFTTIMNMAKEALFWWTLIGIRVRLVKDIRTLIAKMVWDPETYCNLFEIERAKKSIP